MELLINLTIKSTIILLLAGTVLGVLKNRTATLRHWIISLTLVGLLILPLLLVLLPAITVTIPYLPTKQAVETINAANTIDVPRPIIPINEEKSQLETSIVDWDNNENYEYATIEYANNQLITKLERASDANFTLPFSRNEFLVALWFLGMLFFLGKLLIGRYLICQITIKSEPFSLPPSLRDEVIRFTKKTVIFLESKVIKTPMTWGGFQPVILLPMDARLWTEIELKTVLLHELTHIKRNDYWLHTFGLFAVCLYWYNPLIWILKKQQLLEREKACDEAVLYAGIPQQTYAQQLINFARQLSKKSPILKEHALPMAKVSQTKARVLAILKFDKQQFHFSKWRQRNWGLFYTCSLPFLAAFTPVGEVIQEHFDLPKLESIDHFLTTSNISELGLPAFTIKKQGMEIDEPSLVEKKTILKNDTLISIIQLEELERLQKEFDFLAINRTTETINIPHRHQKTGLYSQWKWKEGKSEFEISTFGEFKIIQEPPYIEVVSDDGMVIIQEYKDGLLMDKVHELVLTKAPYDGRMRMLNWRKSIFDSPLIEKGKPIKIWSRDLVKNGGYNNWMEKKGRRIAQHIMDKKPDFLIREDAKEYWSKIERGRGQVDFHFFPEDEILAEKERKRRRAELQSGKIPYRKLDYPIEERRSNIIGRTDLSGKDMGHDFLLKRRQPKGTQYITLLKSKAQPALIKAFNFHLSKNDFDNLYFELQLYNVVDNEIQYAITKSPIFIQVNKGSGWIKKDLSSYGIISQGDVLVVLENTHFSGGKKGRGLYFSLTDDYETYEPIISSILDQAFIMNLDIEQDPNRVGLLEQKANKNVLQPKVSSNAAKAIIKTAVNRLTDNYIQKSHTADLYFRYSSLSPSDSLAYQSEAKLKFFDSKGYQKRSWRNAASSRYAKLEEGRVVVGEQKESLELEELGRFFVFWSHEPIITNDKPISTKSLDAYDFELLGTKEFMGKEVFEIAFVCIKLKDRFAGLPSLKYMKGKVYINKEDYAILKYEQSYLMDYAWTGKHPKKRGHSKERNIIQNTRVEIFSKHEDGYFLDYSKNIDKNETQYTSLDGRKTINKGTFIEEYKYLNINTEKVEPLKENLFNLNKKIKYNPDFWKQYRGVLPR